MSVRDMVTQAMLPHLPNPTSLTKPSCTLSFSHLASPYRQEGQNLCKTAVEEYVISPICMILFSPRGVAVSMSSSSWPSLRPRAAALSSLRPRAAALSCPSCWPCRTRAGPSRRWRWQLIQPPLSCANLNQNATGSCQPAQNHPSIGIGSMNFCRATMNRSSGQQVSEARGQA